MIDTSIYLRPLSEETIKEIEKMEASFKKYTKRSDALDFEESDIFIELDKLNKYNTIYNQRYHKN